MWMKFKFLSRVTWWKVFFKADTANISHKTRPKSKRNKNKRYCKQERRDALLFMYLNVSENGNENKERERENWMKGFLRLKPISFRLSRKKTRHNNIDTSRIFAIVHKIPLIRMECLNQAEIKVWFNRLCGKRHEWLSKEGFWCVGKTQIKGHLKKYKKI